MKSLLKRPEALLVFLGLIFLACAILINTFWVNEPKSAQVIYVSDADKEALTESGEISTVIININTATAEELTKLPGVGEELAERIVKYRDDHGEFHSVEDLLLITGIGNSKYESIKPYVTVD